MKQQQPLTINMTDKEYYKKLVPQKQVLTSHDAGWKNVVLEHHRQPADEMPEVRFQQHIILVQLSKVLCERRIGKSFKLESSQIGDTVIIPAGINHWSADRTDSEFIAIAIKPQQLIHSSEDLIKGDSFELIPTFAEPDSFIYGTALALKQELETDYNGCGLYAESLLNALSVHLLRKYSTTKLKVTEEVKGLSPSQVKQIFDLVGDRLGEKIALEEMAQLANLSSFHFVREFKKSVGVTPHKYVIQQRIELAKRLLKRKDLSIADVALDCGFSNQSHLGREFKKHTGTTPKKYRESF